MQVKKDSLRLVFMGTPPFAVPPLRALLERGHEVAGVYTRPDRRAGRGRRLGQSAVKRFALDRGLAVFQPASLMRAPDAISEMASLAPEAIVVAAYGAFLPKETLDLPRLGCLNIHPSLLPRWRGPSPVASAILEGDEITGVSVILLDEGVDTGPVLARRHTDILRAEKADALTHRLFSIGSALLADTLDDWNEGRIDPQAQDESQATSTRLLKREDGRIDWTEPAALLERKARAFHPWPGTFTTWRGKTLKIWEARAVEAAGGGGAPGTVTRLGGGAVVVAAGAGSLELIEVQIEGGVRLPAEDFCRGRDFAGSKLGS